eukprot:18065-Heterococcus_DN1.PRE.2
MTMADTIETAYAYLMPRPLHISHMTNLAGCASGVSPARDDVYWREASQDVRDGIYFAALIQDWMKRSRQCVVLSSI